MQIKTRLNILIAIALRSATSVTTRALVLATLAVVASTNSNAEYASAGFQDFGTNPFASGQDLFIQAYSYEGPSGSVSASATKGPLPSISGSNAAGIPTATSQTNSILEINLQYSFQIHGPNIFVLVPVIVSGAYWLESIGNNYSIGSAYVALNLSGGTGYGFPDNCIYDCSKTGTFSGLVSLFSDRDVTIQEYVALNAQSWPAPNGVVASAAAYIDPYISIDPTWALTNPGYSVTVTPGFGNEAPMNSVPEPETYTLLLFGLVLIGAVVRRSKQKNGLSRFALA